MTVITRIPASKRMTTVHHTTAALIAASLMAGGIGMVPSAMADVIHITNGVNAYAGGSDNTIYSESGSLADGGGDYLFSGQNNQANNRRSLISFDLTGLGLDNPNLQITEVSLTMTVVNTNTTSRDVSLFRLTSSWGEGTEDAGGAEGQGVSATTGTSTWTDRFYDSTLWNSPGGDRAGLASGSGTAPTSGAFTITGAGMLQDVMAWLADPGSNAGWALLGDENTLGSAIRYVSGDNNEGGYELADRPTLNIEYRVVPAPGAIVPMLLFGAGGLGLTRQRRRPRPGACSEAPTS